MARILENAKPIRSALFFVALTVIPACSSYSQSAAADPASAEPKPQAAQSAPEPNQASKTDTPTELSSTATPEEVRQNQIEADTNKLYQLSAELRAEVAKTYKESLSLTVLKKAQDLEKLAKKLKAEMNLDVAAAKH